MPSGSAGSRLLLRLRQPALSGHSFAERSWPAESATESWSGRRGSNPRPTAWKAVTLPLSYSRLRALPVAPLGAAVGKSASTTIHTSQRDSCRPDVSRLASRSSRPIRARAKAGGEGRIRTSEATWATDLQSVAFDRSATSPTFCRRSATRPATRPPAAAWGQLLITKPHDS